jgi:Uri superfamily endonuclease
MALFWGSCIYCRRIDAEMSSAFSTPVSQVDGFGGSTDASGLTQKTRLAWSAVRGFLFRLG